MVEKSKVSVKDIAKLSNVSIGTVDRVIHNRKGVSPATRKLVQDIIDQTGYKKNIVASRLASKKTITLATLLPKGPKPTDYWNLHQQGLTKAYGNLVDLGLVLKHYYFEILDVSSFKSAWEKIQNEHFDGLITVPIFEKLMEDVVMYCTTNEKALLFVDANSEKFKDVSFIGQNAYKAGKACARLMYFITPPESNFLVVNISRGDKVHINNLQREQGFRSFFKEKGLKNNIITISNRLENLADFVDELKEFRIGRNEIHGVFVTNSRSSFVVEALNLLDQNNVKIIGFDLNEKNVDYLNQEKIHFLIDQKPGLQSERAVDVAFRAIAYGIHETGDLAMPVEVVLKENSD